MRSVQYSSADHTVTHHHTSRIYSESPKSNPVRKQSRQSQDAQAFENTFEYFKHVGNLSNQNPKRRSSKPIDCSESLVELEEVLFSYSVSEDTNKSGLARSKKMTIDGKRSSEMEDTHYCSFPFTSQNLALFCVFDGHAGKDCASELITLFPKIFKKHWKKSKDKAQTDFTNLWIEVYKEVDGLLAQFEDLGSTATTLLIWRTPDGKRYIQCANVGDSTAFLVRENKVIPMSQDHKLSVKSERHRITNSGIHLEEKQTRLNGIAITRAFGDHFAKNHNCGLISEPFVSPAMEITPKDTRVILASDGLWDVVKGQRACDITKGIKESGDAAKKLLQTAVKSNHCTDNVTVIVVNLR
uniref:PPM-type phosphatase domain-containing protein n=1 Tax=Arcella intermedia TaxID=1963864 RepID=A0A6B2L5R3_9EUKA